VIERLAADGRPGRLIFRGAGPPDELDFSFSGLKTSLRYRLEKMTTAEVRARRADLCASYQQAVDRCAGAKDGWRAASEAPYRSLGLSGGRGQQPGPCGRAWAEAGGCGSLPGGGAPAYRRQCRHDRLCRLGGSGGGTRGGDLRGWPSASSRARRSMAARTPGQGGRPVRSSVVAAQIARQQAEFLAVLGDGAAGDGDALFLELATSS
jgi:hypothetical protein